jgi:hypothetical protein
MATPLLITTSRRRALSTWHCVSGKACRSSSRPCTGKAPNLHSGGSLARQVSASRNKSPPRTTSPAPTSAWTQTHDSGEAADVCGEENLHVTQEQQLAAMQATFPGRSLNAILTSRTTITSPSTSTVPHAKLSPRHSSTLYDACGPRFRLTRGKSSKYSGKPRQDQTTRGEGQVSRSEQPDPATRRLPRQGIKAKLQCSLTDDDVRRDVPVVRHCSSFFLSFVPLPL